MKLHLNAHMTAQDYADAQILHGRRTMLLVNAILFVFVAGLLLYFFFDSGNAGGRISACLGAVFVLVMRFVLRNRGLTFRATRAYNQQKALHQPYEIDINDKGLTFSWGKGKGQLPWKDIRRWNANEKVILVYQTDLQFHLLARHYFASDADYRGLQDFLAKKIGPKDGKAKL